MEKYEEMRESLKVKSLRSKFIQKLYINYNNYVIYFFATVNQFVDASCDILNTIESTNFKVHYKLAILNIDYKKEDKLYQEQMAITPEKLTILLNGKCLSLKFKFFFKKYLH